MGPVVGSLDPRIGSPPLCSQAFFSEIAFLACSVRAVSARTRDLGTTTRFLRNLAGSFRTT